MVISLAAAEASGAPPNAFGDGLSRQGPWRKRRNSLSTTWTALCAFAVPDDSDEVINALRSEGLSVRKSALQHPDALDVPSGDVQPPFRVSLAWAQRGRALALALARPARRWVGSRQAVLFPVGLASGRRLQSCSLGTTPLYVLSSTP